ncbi:MAG: hypothetical protein H6576_08895 [Lewinellaceae bacterium]|nr:hypothetical protein [Saprospiraceae bacterium]MCB9343801.1 hypothetical protein [Lewinellaceae bacterium]
MNKVQILSLIASAILFLGLYVGLDRRPPEKSSLDAEQGKEVNAFEWKTVLKEKKQALSKEQDELLENLENQTSEATNEAEKVLRLKNLSSFWYDNGSALLAGQYAGQAAQIENSDSTWSVTGATFFNALTTSQEELERNYCAGQAVNAFEEASKIDPDKAEHQVNIALVLAENPPPDNPMKAVLMLRELENKYPNEPSVYNALGRLAIKTGQWQKAVERLEKAWKLDNKNINTPCLLAMAYQGLGDNNKANEYAAICKNR